MVDVIVSSDGTLEVILLLAAIATLDDLDHLGAVGIELIIALGDLRAVLLPEKLVDGAPEQQGHLLLDKLFEDLGDLEVELEKPHPQGLVRGMRLAHRLQ